ncbi:hypothetical protein CLAIMM_02010 [Cladophialophora immunda]|nr:hypothetical protein CLAIMM_02010 [Cladophialophora immunda]
MAPDRLLPQIIDDLAQQEPNRIICAIPQNEDIMSGVNEITVLQLSKAIDHAAWFLENTIGRSESFETLAYIGPHDLRYAILSVAAPKAGYKSFFISPRNSLEGQTSLLKAKKCTLLLTPATLPAGVAEVLQIAGPGLQLRHVVVPELESWLHVDVSEGHQPYPFTKRFEDSCNEPYMVIHTSGSTGIPKPITLPYRYFISCAAYVEDDYENGVKTLLSYMRERPGRIFHPFPFFHGAGIYLFYTFSLFLRQIPVVLTPKPLTAELADTYHRSGEVTSSFLPPSILDDISKDTSFTRNLSKLQFIMVSGAPLSQTVGDKVKPHTRILNFIGQTESGMLPHLFVGDDDYMYVRFFTRAGMEMRHRTEDLYEAVITRREGCERFQPAFAVSPQLNELGMNDLFSRHPDPAKSDHWLHRGRADDIIVLDNGEKVNPTSMEQTIATHPKVKTVMIVGEGRFQVAALIETTTAAAEADMDLSLPSSRVAFIEQLWPLVEQANAEIPAHGRLTKELVLFVEPERPLLRTSKGTLQRRASARSYLKELNSAYQALEESSGSAFVSTTIDLDKGDVDIQSDLRDLLENITGLKPSGDADFFAHGMDSLLALKVFRALKQSLSQYPEVVKRLYSSLIYNHPTVETLAQALSGLRKSAKPAGRTGSATTQGTTEDEQQRRDKIRKTIERYATTTSPPPRTPSDQCQSAVSAASAQMQMLYPSRCSPSGRHVLLTGTTGGFGTYILAALLSDPSISHIYCLNRSADAKERQIAAHEYHALISPLDPPSRVRVTFYQVDFSRENLNLSPEVYNHLLTHTTDIIHNAWTVNFNQSLASFAPTMLSGLRSLIDLAIRARAPGPHKSRFTFISSLGTMVRWKAAGRSGAASEEINHDIDVVERMGYAESKYVAEHILADAARTHGLHVNIVRVGQIAGPVKSGERGCWNRAEWLPRLIASSAELGMLPDSLGANEIIDWTPIDVLAAALLEIILPTPSADHLETDTETENVGVGVGVGVYHLVNPSRTTWEKLYPTVLERLSQARGPGQDLQLVSYDKWVAGLEESGARSHATTTTTAMDVDRNPAFKLLSFFQSSATTGTSDMTTEYSTKKAQERSPTLRSCGPVTRAWMQLWLKQWGW